MSAKYRFKSKIMEEKICRNAILVKCYRYWGKRTIDILISVVVLLIIWPLLILIAIFIKLDSPGPVIFTQKRIGKNGKVFNIYKFRTMIYQHRSVDREIYGYDPEVTRVGYWLRRFKMDELLQLINVFKGDMSIVGPRPGLPSQFLQYDKIAKKRLLVRPGITGLAQVNGNRYLSWPERWYYDALYVDNFSFCLDIWIMYRTVIVIFKGEQYFFAPPIKKEE